MEDPQRHQVLRLLALPQAWSTQASYTILDLDDPCGLRFVTLWALWRHDPKRCTRLHVVLVLATLPCVQALRARLCAVLPPETHRLVEQLALQWPLNLPGLHRLEFESLSITLTLAVGGTSVLLARLSLAADVVLLSPQVLAMSEHEQRVVANALVGLIEHDALLLAPSEARSWPHSFEKILGLSEQASHAGEHARLVVRQEQNQAQNQALATTQKHSFFLRARASAQAVAVSYPNAWRGLATASQQMIVVGGGLAGLHVAHALCLRGWQVTVLDAAQACVGQQTTHLAAALTPVVSRDDDPYARLSRAGCLRALARWGALSDAGVTGCGALQLQRATGRIVDLKKIADELDFPEQWLRFVDAAQASELAGMTLARGGLYFSKAQRVQPHRLLKVLAQTEGLTIRHAYAARLESHAQQWCVRDRAGHVVAQAPQIVLAGGLETQSLLEASGLRGMGSRLSSMDAVAGELTYVEQALLAGGPRCIVSGDGYVLPALEGLCVVGASYLNEPHPAGSTRAGRQANLKRLERLFNDPLSLGPHETGALKGWVGQRAVVPDRFPVVGPLLHAPGLWVATGFASRGLTWASLVGDLIAAALNSEPLPLENDIIMKISQI
jgi:tRNA 5-methylaminomethyl-2-thiouridine biosynthesis bifunctional protein